MTDQSQDIPIETEMHAAVRKMGGAVLIDEFGPSPPFENADYVFRADNVIAELKSLENDTESGEPFRVKVNALHDKWLRDHLIPRPLGFGTFRIDSAKLPEACQMDVLDILKDRIQKVVKKAARQITSTRTQLGMSDGKGLLLLANDGDRLFSVEMIAYCLNRTLTRQHPQINSVVVFSANELVSLPGVPTPARVWVEFQISDKPQPDRSPVSQEFLRRFRAGWFNHLADVTKQPTIAFDQTGKSDIRNMPWQRR